MNIYIYIILFILLTALNIQLIVPIKRKKELFLTLTFMVLFIVSAFRVEVGIDFINYRGTFGLVNRTSSLVELYGLSLSSSVEMGYLILNKVVGYFTDERQWIFVATSFITILLIFKGIKENSRIIWLSVLLFAIGPYIAGFNIIRQYIAVAILFYSYKYIISRDFLKFMVSIFIASTFHVSILFMVPFFFVVNKSLDLKKLLFIAMVGILSSFYLGDIIRILQSLFYGYYSETSFGIRSGNINNVIISMFYFIAAYTSKDRLIEKNPKNTALINFSFINLLIASMSMNTWIITRFMPYTSIFNILLIPEIVASTKNCYIKIMLGFGFVLLSLFLFFSTIYNPENQLLPYQFYWMSNF